MSNLTITKIEKNFLSQNSRDTATSTYITSIFREALCLKQGKGKKCSGN